MQISPCHASEKPNVGWCYPVIDLWLLTAALHLRAYDEGNKLTVGIDVWLERPSVLKV